MFDFREFALCRELDPEVFFPVGVPGAPAYDAQVLAAKGVCADCPVRRDCAEFAFFLGLEFGVFGGLDGPERAALRRTPQRASA